MLYKEKRVPFVQRILSERPLCEACPVWAEHDGLEMFVHRPSADVHEVLSRGRSGGVHGQAWLDESNVLAVCRPCHTRITDSDGDATTLGLLRQTEASDLTESDQPGYTPSS